MPELANVEKWDYGIMVVNPGFLHGKLAACRKGACNTASGSASKQEHQVT